MRDAMLDRQGVKMKTLTNPQNDFPMVRRTNDLKQALQAYDSDCRELLDCQSKGRFKVQGGAMTSEDVKTAIQVMLARARLAYIEDTGEFPSDGETASYDLGQVVALEKVDAYLTRIEGRLK